ncbi:hypothetical protein CVV38_00790 [Candidatus Peregrinibacteria bacterium HGW-Peregrinibacteria-1]|jgi:superfamily II DNA or RNA helicase/SAM-dependent methyltransferase|nr:MAG: hypothetical protein CVV38_00790 [Candidatus Peregrinibacteria bacterium HGW-Peregrinibacteria-1]
MIGKIELSKLVSNEARELIKKTPRLNDAVVKLLTDFNRLYSSYQISNIQDIFEACEIFDREVQISPSLSKDITSVRKKIRGALIEMLYTSETSNLKLGAWETVDQLTRERDLGKAVAELIDILQEKKPEQFNQQWIGIADKNLYEHLKNLLKNPQTNTVNWEDLKRLLPEAFATKFKITVNTSREEQVVKIINEYRSIIEMLGAESAAEALLALGLIEEGNYSQTLNIIGEHLGTCQIPFPNLTDIDALPEIVIDLPSIRKLLFIRLRNLVYQELVKDEDESVPLEIHKNRLEKLRQRTRAILKKKLGKEKSAHQGLYDEVIAYFEEILKIKSPTNMVDRIIGKNGRSYYFPSIRQKMAMKELSDKQRLLVAFFMGKGKTGVAFLTKEMVKAKKMLYICPGGELIDEIEARISKYYKKGKAPSVGRIEAPLDAEKLEQALKCDIVIMPFSMLGSKVDNKSVNDQLSETEFDFMVVDEVHNAKREGKLWTEEINKLANSIPDLYENGHIVLLSGDPTPNSPSDIVPQLRLLDRTKFGESRSLKAVVKKLGPLTLRTILLESMLLIDEPEDWEKYIKLQTFDLSPKERSFYEAIRSNDELSHSEKARQLSLFLMSPWLFVDESSEEIGSYVKQTAETVKKYLFEEDEDAILITVNDFKQGVLRDHDDYPGKKPFVSKLQELLPADIDWYIIDGDITKNEQKEIIKKSRNVTKKTVIVAMSNALREGINLSHMKRGICIGPDYNKPNDAQRIKRQAREGNEDVEITMLMPKDSFFTAKHRHAEQKYSLTQRMKYGGTLTENDLELLDGEDFSDTVRIEDGVVYIGTKLVDHLSTPSKKLNALISHLHNKGRQYWEKFIENYGEYFTKLYMERDKKSPSSNNGRFVSSLIRKLEDKKILPSTEGSPLYCDLACGPLVLERALSVDKVSRKIYNLDLNEYMLEYGLKEHPQRKTSVQQGAINDMQGIYEDEFFDLINCSFALYFSKNNRRSKNPENNERSQALMEFNRVLKPGGIAIITLPSNVGTDIERQNFITHLREAFGFEIVENYTGIAQSTDKKEEGKFSNYTIVCKKIDLPKKELIDPLKLALSRIAVIPKTRSFSELTSAEDFEPPLHSEFKINDHELTYDYTDEIEEKDEYNIYKQIDEARLYLRQLVSKLGTLNNLPQEYQAEMKEKNVCLIHYGGENFSFCFLTDNPMRPYSIA